MTQYNRFNPTIFEYHKKKYVLMRCESDPQNWDVSLFSYTISELDSKLNIIRTNICKFIVNDIEFSSKYRIDIYREYILEDIRVFKRKINGRVIGFSNVLMSYNPSVFRVGVVEINVKEKSIRLLHIYDNVYYENEKNWNLFSHKKKYYVIYSIIPLRIYKWDENTYSIERHLISHDTSDYISRYQLDRYMYPSYNNMYLTNVWGHIKINNRLCFYAKHKYVNGEYMYYRMELEMRDTRIVVKKFFKTDIHAPDFNNKKMYLNDFKEMNGCIYFCFGVCDTNFLVYKIKKDKFLNDSESKVGSNDYSDTVGGICGSTTVSSVVVDGCSCSSAP